MQIYQVDENNYPNNWNDFVEMFPNGSIYHTREWMNVVRKSFKLKECSLVAMKNGDIKGLLPLWKTKNSKFINSPWRDRADLLVTDENTQSKLYKRLEEIRGNVVLKGWESPTGPDGYERVNYWISSCVDISYGAEALWTQIKKRVGRNVRKAKNSGLIVERDESETGMKKFYRLFCLTRKRLGVPIYPYFFFDNIRNFLPSKSIHVYLGKYEGNIVSGLLVLSYAGKAIYAFGGSDFNWQHLRGNDLVFWTAIQDAANRGDYVFDFGSDSPQQESLLRFKEKWGAERYNLPTLIKPIGFYNPDNDDFGANKYAMYRAILKKFPCFGLIIIGYFCTHKKG